MTTLKFDEQNFGLDALKTVTGLKFGWQELGQGLWVTLNENKKRGTRFVFRRVMDDVTRLEWDQLVATTLAMARAKELNPHCRPKVTWVQSRYAAMLDVVYAMYHLVQSLCTMLFPLSRFDSWAVFWITRGIFERNKEEHKCYSTLLQMARVWQFANGSIENMNLVRDTVCHEGVHGLLDNTTISHKLEGESDLSGTIIQLHDVVFYKNGWLPVDYGQRGKFPLAVAVFAVSLCMVHPSTRDALSETAETYQRNVRKRKRCKQVIV